MASLHIPLPRGGALFVGLTKKVLPQRFLIWYVAGNEFLINVNFVLHLEAVLTLPVFT